MNLIGKLFAQQRNNTICYYEIEIEYPIIKNKSFELDDKYYRLHYKEEEDGSKEMFSLCGFNVLWIKNRHETKVDEKIMNKAKEILQKL